MRDLKFDFEVEDDFASYLGIAIETFPDNTRHMTQKGLIQKIIDTTGLTGCNPNWTPAAQLALPKDLDGEPYDNQEWDYSRDRKSVV